ncbi:MAG: GNAT family N-acetyltransferase [Pseudomonadota bacterium]
MSITIRAVCGPDIAPYIDDLAALRIEVFRSFPYLYDGTREYEKQYIGKYAQSPESLFVLAFDGNEVVGVSTGVPMRDETAEFKAPFLAAGYNPERIFYFGESVLREVYRGRGLGVRFFEERERYAMQLGRFEYTAFCAVERPADHPLRPAGYVPLDRFWINRGYRKHPEFQSVYRWKDIDQPGTTDHIMTFWMKHWPDVMV